MTSAARDSPIPSSISTILGDAGGAQQRLLTITSAGGHPTADHSSIARAPAKTKMAFGSLICAAGRPALTSISSGRRLKQSPERHEKGGIAAAFSSACAAADLTKRLFRAACAAANSFLQPDISEPLVQRRTERALVYFYAQVSAKVVRFHLSRMVRIRSFRQLAIARPMDIFQMDPERRLRRAVSRRNRCTLAAMPMWPPGSFLASQLSVRQGKRKGGIAATFSSACAAADLTKNLSRATCAAANSFFQRDNSEPLVQRRTERAWEYSHIRYRRRSIASTS